MAYLPWIIILHSLFLVSDDLFDSVFSTETLTEATVDFGSVPLETKNAGKLRVKHPVGMSIKAIKSSCGCSVASSQQVSETETEVLVILRTLKLGDVRSTLKIELSDGSLKVINLSGAFVSAVTASPRVLVIDEVQPVSLVFDWSATRMTKPTIMCDDNRFKVSVEVTGKGKTTITFGPAKPLEKGDIAFVTDVGFVFSEGNRHYQMSLPVKRSRPSLIVPSLQFVDAVDKPLRFIIVTDKQSSVGRTGRCRLRGLDQEFETGGWVEKEKESSISVIFPVDWIGNPIPKDLDRLALEMEFTRESEISWKEIGVVTVKVR